MERNRIPLVLIQTQGCLCLLGSLFALHHISHLSGCSFQNSFHEPASKCKHFPRKASSSSFVPVFINYPESNRHSMRSDILKVVHFICKYCKNLISLISIKMSIIPEPCICVSKVVPNTTNCLCKKDRLVDIIFKCRIGICVHTFHVPNCCDVQRKNLLLWKQMPACYVFDENQDRSLADAKFISDFKTEHQVTTQLCDGCERYRFRSEKSFGRCGGCKNVGYCSTECQKADWKKHKVLCKMLQGKATEAEISQHNLLPNTNKLQDLLPSYNFLKGQTCKCMNAVQLYRAKSMESGICSRRGCQKKVPQWILPESGIWKCPIYSIMHVDCAHYCGEKCRRKATKDFQPIDISMGHIQM